MGKILFVIFLILLLFICIPFIQTLFFQKEQNNNFTNPDITKYLQQLRRGLIKSSIANIESKHTVTSIDDKGFLPNTTIPYLYRIQLTIGNNVKGYIYITQKDMEHTTVLIASEGYKKGTLQDLKIGDIFLLERTVKYNVMGKRAPVMLSQKITKINK